jgi:beta-glucanase (GH16 family)
MVSHRQVRAKYKREMAIVAAAALVVGGVSLARSASDTPAEARTRAPQGGAALTAEPTVTQDAIGPTTAAPGTVTGTLGVHSSACLTVQNLVLAVRDAGGANLDFPNQFNKQICPTPTYNYSAQRNLSAGTYTIFGAYRYNNVWHNLPSTTLTVATGTPSPTPTPTPTTPPPVVPPAPGTWDLKFSDDFDGNAVDTSKWSYQSTAEAQWSTNPVGTGNKGNQQMEFDQAANCAVSGGLLSMTGKPDSITSSQGTHYDWSSCMLNTSPSYAFRYGYMETRVKMPTLKGFWPGFWTWGAAGTNISGNGETDAFEVYTNVAKVYQTQHNSGGGGCQVAYPNGGVPGDWHTYGVDIETGGTTWYIDGVQTCHVATTSGGNTNILLDNFVYDGNGDSSKQPAPGSVGVMQVDYVKAWQH